MNGDLQENKVKQSNQSKKWYAFYVKSRSEKKVAEILNLKKIEAYIPLSKTLKQWSDRKKVVELPLFSGYVFVKISEIDFDIAVRTSGVVNFVYVEGKKAVIRDSEIERLKQIVALGYEIETYPTKKKYFEGDKIKITSGVLKNIEGVVIENKEGRFVEILLESIGQIITVKLPKEILTLQKT